MANEFDYLSIIADKDVVDPTYDVSGLRTTTPTDVRLLADVPEYSGLRYDPTQRSYLEDLYNLYSGGLPTIPVAPAPVTTTPVDTPVDTGGGGLDVVDTTSDLPDVTPPAMDQAAAIAAMTPNEAYSLDAPITTGGDTDLPTAPPNILNPEQTELENIARANAMGDTRYNQPVAEDTGQIGRTTDISQQAYNYFNPTVDATADDVYPDAIDTTLQDMAKNVAEERLTPVTLEDPSRVLVSGRGIGNYETPEYSDVTTPVAPPSVLNPPAAEIYQDPIMSMAEEQARQEMIASPTADEGFEDQLNTPEVQEDLAKVKEGVSDATGFISRWGLPLWNAAQGQWGAALAGFAGLPGAVLGLTAGLGGGVPNKANIGGLNQEQADLVDNYSVGNTGKDELGKNIISMAEMLNPGQYLENRIKRGQDVTDEDLEKLGYIDPVSPDVAAGKEFETGDAALAEQIEAEKREQAAAEAAAIEQARAQREMQEQIAAAEAMEAARQADIDRQNREAAAAAAATQRARDAASRPSGEGAGAGGGSQQATSGGGFSRGWGGGWGWSKGGIVSLKNGKR